MIGHCVMTTSGAEGKYLTTLRNLAFRDEWGRGGRKSANFASKFALCASGFRSLLRYAWPK